MTESEWLACDDPNRMIHWLGDGVEMVRTRWHGVAAARVLRTSERKLWLYMVAAHRADADTLATLAGHHMLDALGDWADGVGSLVEIGRAIDVGCEVEGEMVGLLRALGDSLEEQQSALERVTAFCRRAGGQVEAEQPAPHTAPLLREVVGNPFRPPVIDPVWLTANDGAARRMAEGIASSRAFGDMPILADALEDAGCADEAILSHCRTPAGHVRGCWVIDALRGRA